jgi:hypothetical protein
MKAIDECNPTSNEYKYWDIYYIGGDPITGRWIARRFGVELCANTRELLKEMIELKARTETQRRIDSK